MPITTSVNSSQKNSNSAPELTRKLVNHRLVPPTFDPRPYPPFSVSFETRYSSSDGKIPFNRKSASEAYPRIEKLPLPRFHVHPLVLAAHNSRCCPDR